MNRTDSRRDRPGKYFLCRPLRQEPPQKRLQQPAKHETYRKNTKVEEGAAWSRWHWSRSAPPFHGVGDAPLQRIPRRRGRQHVQLGFRLLREIQRAVAGDFQAAGTLN